MALGITRQVPTVKVAALQPTTANGDPEGNLARALPLVERAAEQGAQLILLPELLRAGYALTPDIWAYAEPSRGGPTERFLCTAAGRLRVHVGCTFLEASSNGHFYNTFILAGPEGGLLGAARKSTPASFEAFLFRGDPTWPAIIPVPLLGLVVGVLICADNLLSAPALRLLGQCVFAPGRGAPAAGERRVWEGEVIVPDLLLMPFSAPLPPVGPHCTAEDAALVERNLRGAASARAELLGLPAVLSNKSGRWDSPLPLGQPPVVGAAFAGYSTIAAAGGRVLAQAGPADRDAVLVADVALDPQKKTWAANVRRAAAAAGRYAPASMPSDAWKTRLAEAIGSAWYETSRRRQAAARAVNPARPRPAPWTAAGAAAVAGLVLAPVAAAAYYYRARA